MNQLSNIKDNELLKQFDLLVKEEKEAIASIVIHLSEIDRRKLYAPEGYSSLFNYCTQKYHYSESAAYRRIKAARLSNTFPEIIDLLKEGKINLETISLIASHITQENKEGFLSKIVHKSTREVENIISYLFGKERIEKDKIRILPQIKKPEIAQNFTSGAGSSLKEDGGKKPEKALELSLAFSPSNSDRDPSPSAQDDSKEIRRVKIEFVADEKLAKKIERARQLLRHKYPQGKFEDIFNEALELLLEKKDPERKNQRMEQKETKQKINEPKSKPPMETRYIPQALRREIWKRDQGKCTFVSKDGKQCNEGAMLELDHIEPYALGGKTSSENLRVLCSNHNKWRSEKTFGFGQGRSI